MTDGGVCTDAEFVMLPDAGAFAVIRYSTVALAGSVPMIAEKALPETDGGEQLAPPVLL